MRLKLLVTCLLATFRFQTLPDDETFIRQMSDAAASRLTIQYAAEIQVTATEQGKPVDSQSGTASMNVAFANPGKVAVETKGFRGEHILSPTATAHGNMNRRQRGIPASVRDSD